MTVDRMMEVWSGGSNVRAVREGDEGLGGRECRYLNHAQKSEGIRGITALPTIGFKLGRQEIKSVCESEA